MDEDYQNEDYQNDSASEELSHVWELQPESELAWTESRTLDQGYQNAEREYEYIVFPDIQMRRLQEEGVQTKPAPFASKNDKWRAPGKKPFVVFSVLLLLSLLMMVAALVLVCHRCVLICPDGWEKFHDKCYYYNTEVKEWGEARSSCQQQGVDLLVIDHEKEQEFPEETWHPKEDFWIGLSYIKTEQIWRWVDNKTPFYTMWKEGNPEMREHVENSRDCVVSEPASNYRWKNTFCQKRHPSICEKSRHVACALRSPFAPH